MATKKQAQSKEQIVAQPPAPPRPPAPPIPEPAPTDTENRCTATDDEGRQCWFVVHDETVDHVFDEAEAEAVAAEGLPEADGDTETTAEAGDGADGQQDSPEPSEVKEKKPRGRKAVAPSRVSVNTWWCAVCGNGNPHESAGMTVEKCFRCGTPRLIETVV